MSTIGFLHTASVHRSAFDAMTAAAGSHDTVVRVDEHLLANARRLGPDHDSVGSAIDAALEALAADGADVIVCTCSTIGGEAERRAGAVPVIRIDRPMAEAAVRMGPRVTIVAALTSTLTPTRELLEAVAAQANAAISIETMLCEQAWELFADGEIDEYMHAIAATCRDVEDRADVIVLAQASMAGAVDLLGLGPRPMSTPVLCSPQLAVDAAINALGLR